MWQVALAALHMDYNPATSCISNKQDAPAAKTLLLKKLPFAVAALGQIPAFLHCIVNFHSSVLISIPHIWQIILSELSNEYSWFFLILWIGIITLLWKLYPSYLWVAWKISETFSTLSVAAFLYFTAGSEPFNQWHPSISFFIENCLRMLKMMEPLSDSSSQAFSEHNSL